MVSQHDKRHLQSIFFPLLFSFPTLSSGRISGFIYPGIRLWFGFQSFKRRKIIKNILTFMIKARCYLVERKLFCHRCINRTAIACWDKSLKSWCRLKVLRYTFNRIIIWKDSSKLVSQLTKWDPPYNCISGLDWTSFKSLLLYQSQENGVYHASCKVHSAQRIDLYTPYKSVTDSVPK